MAAPAPASAAAPKARECGECNACCQGWLAAKVGDFDMRPGAPCPHVCAAGCGIYERRPEHPCRSFRCGWLVEGNPFPEHFRPDRLGLIFVSIQWRGRRAWILVPTGTEPDETLLAQMRQYTRDTGEPHMVKKPNSILCFGAPEFQQDMLAKHQRGDNPW